MTRLLLSLILVSSFVANTTFAASFTVNSTSDSVDAVPGDGICADSLSRCTLRAAIGEANTLAGSDSISLPAGTFALSLIGASENSNATGDLDIADELSISGAGIDQSIIDGLNLDRVLHVTVASNITLSNLTVKRGRTAADSGAGLLSAVGGGISLNSVKFFLNQAESGGAVLGTGQLTVVNSLFSQNQATLSNGGAILLTGAVALNISGSEFSQNSAADSGGGIVAVGLTSAVISDTDFSDNQATSSSGGDMLVTSSGAITLTGISSNRAFAETVAGSSYIIGAGITVNSSTFSGSSTSNTGAGGALLLNSSTTVNIDGMSIEDSTASTGGGLYAIVATGLSIANSSFVRGKALSDVAGCVYGVVGSGDFTLTNSTFTECESGGSSGGAALVVTGATNASISSSSFEDNLSLGTIGAVLLVGTNASISNSNFQRNKVFKTSALGGAVYVTGGSLNLTKNTFSQNQANGAGAIGGGLISVASTNTLENNTFSENSATDSAGGLAASGTTTLRNSTFSGNTATTAAHVRSLGVVTTLNSIYGSSATTACTGVFVSDGKNIDQSNTCGFAGTGDQNSVDPKLVALADNGGGLLTHALMSSSPAIDAFSDSTCPSSDQRGISRPFDGDQNGSAACDIGAFEYNDACPNDPAKQVPGTCGCGTADTDTNANLITDCLANSDLENQATTLRSKVNRLRGSSTGTSQSALKNEIRTLLSALDTFSQTWSANVTVTGSRTLAQLVSKVKRTSRRALRTDLSDFTENKRKAKEAINQLRNAI